MAADIESTEEAPETDGRAQAKKWTVEFAACTKELERWWKQGDKVVKRFRDDRESQQMTRMRLNLFTANVQTQQALLYGQPPKVDVTRRFGDATDDVARVAAEMMERLLNNDLEMPGDTSAEAFAGALEDRLLSGAGFVRVRYEADFDEAQPEAAETPSDEGEEHGLTDTTEPQETKTGERICTEYVYWRDARWSPVKRFHDLRWFAFPADMSREALEQRFGEEKAAAVPMKPKGEAGGDNSSEKNNPNDRARVWEIWCKESKYVYWWVEGMGDVLDAQPDPLELPGFWPMPPPLMANLTTSHMVPVPDYVLAQDQYDAIDLLKTRIDLLVRAIRATGVYDGSNEEVKRVLEESGENKLYPAKNWGALTEKGGINGAIQMFDTEVLMKTVNALRVELEATEQELFQVTGMSDIMRGQASEPGTTATEQGIKAKFGSVRMQALQDRFARFVTDVQRIKAAIIVQFFDDATIIEQSNVLFTPDKDLAQQAVQLLRDRKGMLRVEVKPESVSLADFAQQRGEATEFVTALSQFITATAPMAQTMPGVAPYLLELLGTVVSKLKFSSQAEGIIDRAVAMLQQGAQQPQAAAPPDPKLQAAQLKAATDMQKVQLEHESDMAKISAETQAEVAKQQAQAIWNVREEEARARIKAHYTPPKPPRGPQQ